MKGHGLKRICVDDLDKKQREAYFYQKVSALLADYGFVCNWLIADWQGADFIAVDGKGLDLKIQLKSGGYEINQKYCAYKDLWMLFQQQKTWYLIKHCDLVKKADETTGHLKAKAWKEKPHKFIIARAKSLPIELEKALKGYKIN